jgi:D-amino-acid dehydrogenase
MTQGRDDVLVLGGGAIGLACALYLLRDGRAVRVLEQATLGSGASLGNCGTLTPSHATPLAGPGMIGQAMRWMLRPDAPLYVRPRPDPRLAAWLLRVASRCNRRDWIATSKARATLLDASRREIETLIRDRGIDCGFEPSGLVYAFRDADRLAHMAAEFEQLAALGIDVQHWDPARLATEEPALKPGMAGGVYFPGDAHLRPEPYLAGLVAAVREAGGVIEEGCEVTGFRREGARITGVETHDGRRDAREVVLAVGAWSAPLGRQLGLRLPIQPGKGYSITYSRPARAPRRPLVLKERLVCVTTWADGFRLGSTMEFAGYDTRLNRVRLDALERGAAEYLHQPVGPRKLAEWYGWRPMTWDDLPIIGAAPGYDNLLLATGHGMLGITMSAATGRLVADLIAGRPPAFDPAPYSPARFG